MTWTLEQVWTAVLILVSGLLFVAGAIYTIGKALDTVRGWRQPKTDLAKKISEHEERLCSGNKRFEQQDRMIADMQEGQRVICVGVQALLESAVYGNNQSGIKMAHTELKAYLTDGIGKK